LRVYIAEAHEHVQKLVSVVKMATMLEEHNTKEQNSLVIFLWVKGLNAKDIHKEMFPVHDGSRNFIKEIESSRWCSTKGGSG
jgi:hypothetical protein